MTQYILLTSQRNEILELIKETKLDPFNFKWTEVLSKFTTDDSSVPVTVSQILYQGTSFYFTFDLNTRQHYTFYSPAEDKLHDSEFPGSWEGQLQYFRKWLHYLQREVGQPDMWEELAKYQLPPGAELTPNAGNEPFTLPQVEQIVSGINKVRESLMNEFGDGEEEQNLINEKLDYLIDAAKRQGRKDWFHTCIGVLFGLATALAMSPEQTKHLWSLLKNAITGVLRFLPV